MGHFDLVIFDCDGALVDSERIGSEVLADLLAKFGTAVTFHKATSIFSGPLVNDFRRAAEKCVGVF